MGTLGGIGAILIVLCFVIVGLRGWGKVVVDYLRHLLIRGSKGVARGPVSGAQNNVNDQVEQASSVSPLVSSRFAAQEHTRLADKYWFEEHNFKEALREYTEALRIDPDYDLARSNLGSLYMREGRLEEAIIEFKEVLRRGTSSTVIRHNTETWLREALDEIKRKREQGRVETPVPSKMGRLSNYLKRLRRC